MGLRWRAGPRRHGVEAAEERKERRQEEEGRVWLALEEATRREVAVHQQRGHGGVWTRWRPTSSHPAVFTRSSRKASFSPFRTGCSTGFKNDVTPRIPTSSQSHAERDCQCCQDETNASRPTDGPRGEAHGPLRLHAALRAFPPTSPSRALPCRKQFPC